MNSVTGQEGTVSFTRGTLQPRLDGPRAAENATITIGGQTYTGRTVIINSGVTAVPGWTASFDLFGGRGSRGSAWDGGFGWGTHFGHEHEVRVSRTGNLIAKTQTSPVRTLTCTLNVDTYEHGIGECLGGDGTRYALQF